MRLLGSNTSLEEQAGIIILSQEPCFRVYYGSLPSPQNLGPSQQSALSFLSSQLGLSLQTMKAVKGLLFPETLTLPFTTERLRRVEREPTAYQAVMG